VLTPAEWRALHVVRHGLNNRQIARHFGVSLDAVKFHVSNIVAKLGVESRSELLHWRGIPNDSALFRRKATAMTSSLDLGFVGQISRTVKNIEESVEWYGKVLGLRHLFTFGKLAFFDLSGTRLYLQQDDAPDAESTLYFRVSDIVSAYEELRGRGVEFVSAPHLIHRHEDGLEEWMTFFKDLEGRTLALMSQVKAQTVTT
jgi:DNA-binding CsgD family transcriptional regulator/catechol 2,3-dioxygenase-like lactoylglutathione lyase family enzyme